MDSPTKGKILQNSRIKPVPYIKAPYKIGTTWAWSLSIGDPWGDERWKVWEGGIENEYKYQITDKRTLKTDLGEIECFVIESNAKSRIGETKLTAYFNLEYGFVKLNYTNIDGSKTNLALTEHLSGQNDQNKDYQ